MTCMCYFFTRSKGLLTNSWVDFAMSVLQIQEARPNRSESAQSYPANNKHAGFDPESLRVMTHVLYCSTFPPLHQRVLGGEGWQQGPLYLQQVKPFLPPTLLSGKLSTWANMCHISDRFSALPTWLQMRRQWRALKHDFYLSACYHGEGKFQKDSFFLF